MSPRRYWALATATYVALIVYGSLFPWSGWQPPAAADEFVRGVWPRHVSWSDLVSNVLIYLPLGLFGMEWGRVAGRRGGWAIGVCLGGLVVSGAMETLQLCMPGRVSSLSDVVANGVGTGCGVAAALLIGGDGVVAGRLHWLRRQWVADGWLGDVGVAVVLLWVMSQLIPFVPSLDVGNVRAGVRPLWHLFIGSHRFDFAQAGEYGFGVATLALLSVVVVRQRPGRVIAAVVAVSLALKVIVVARALSGEAVVGAALGLVAGLLLARGARRDTARCGLGAACAVATYLVGGLRPGEGATLTMGWIPFAGSLHGWVGLADILETLWWAAAAALFVRRIAPHRRGVAVGGGVALSLLALGVELIQQRIPGRIPDVTDVGVVVLGWSGVWLWSGRVEPPRPTRPPMTPEAERWHPPAAGATRRGGGSPK